MNRLLFEKTGDSVYISHLDLMRIFQRAFKRADIMIWHSQGFSPRAYVSIALPLSVGMESRCEILDFDVEDGSVDLQTLPDKLNKTLPEGIRVLSAYESDRKMKHLAYLRAKLTLEYDGGVMPSCAEEIGKLFSQKELLVHKRTKRGETDLDLIPLIRSLTITQPTADTLIMDALVTAMNPTLNPQLLITAIEACIPAYKPDFAHICREEVYDTEMNIFR